jgi:hypothetical protein
MRRGRRSRIAELHGMSCAASDNRPGLAVTVETPARAGRPE